jgi:hypothetical protein
VQAQERCFDPVLQRYRDVGTESKERFAEERERIAHLNRAQDISMVRGTPFDIINHESKLETIAPGLDPQRCGGGTTLGTRARTDKPGFHHPRTGVDYNILSNKPVHDHHWARPGERPRAKERSPRQRHVPVTHVKDFHIISNQYLNGHEDKIQRDKHMNLLDSTQKHMKTNAFDPVSQTFIDPRKEEAALSAEHARHAESDFRYQAQHPPLMRGREQAFYDMVTHKVHDKDMLQLFDAVAEERNAHRGARYIRERDWHEQDAVGDAVEEARRLNRIGPERHDEIKRRGHDILDNKPFGTGPKERMFHEALPEKRLSPWEKLAARAPTPPTGAAPSKATAPLSSSKSVPTLRPDAEPTTQSGANVTLKLPKAGKSSASSIASSQRKQMGHSASSGTLAGRMPTPAPPGRTAPPPPVIPGSPSGATVYSRQSA